jgi:ribosomal protein S18 acetylase RimI-like enzyme
MLQIRRYQPQDNKVIRELNYAGLAQMNPDVNWRDIPYANSDFDDIEGVYLNNGDFIVGLQDGEIVAMGAFKKRTPECAEFKRLRIRPDCQRKGYGEAIMLKLMNLAAEMGYKEAFLGTLTTNIKAQRLFEKLGFKEIRRGKHGTFDVIFYGKQLNQGGD